MGKLEEYTKRLEELRGQWRTRPLMRDIIERQAKAVKIQIEILKKNGSGNNKRLL